MDYTVVLGSVVGALAGWLVGVPLASAMYERWSRQIDWLLDRLGWPGGDG